MAEPFDLVITGGQVVTGEGVGRATLAVRAGRIAGVLAPEERPAAREQLDADGLHVLPGVIDTHVHLRDPGRPDREDFVSGTSAAAAGGITTILEMPISEPSVHTAAILTERAAVVAPRALVDFALYGAAGHENVDEIAGLAAAGAIAFKTFLTTPMGGREAEFVGLWCTDEGALRRVMRAVAGTGRRHCFHCEHQALLTALEAELRAAGRRDGLAHAESRPPVVEDASVAVLLALAAEAGGPVQVVHMSSPLAARLVRQARASGIDVTAETCPQYLFLTDDALRQHGPFARCNPALRPAAVVDAFWGALDDGTIDVVGSDHAPYLLAEKERALDDIWRAPAGVPGLETMLPLFLTAVNDGRLTLPQVARLLSQRAAEVFRLPGKGRLAPGCDADLTLVDLSAAWTFDPARCFTKARDLMPIYAGRPMRGQVVSTYVRGVRVYHQGAITTAPGHGRFLRPAG